MKKMDKEEYVGERKMLIHLEASGYKDYNKVLLLLSSGAFILSILLLDRMHNPNFMLFLVYTWLFWFVSILMELGSMSTFPKAIHQESIILNDVYKAPEKAPRDNNFYLVMKKLSMLSTLSFSLGVFFFIVFILFNLNCF